MDPLIYTILFVMFFVILYFVGMYFYIQLLRRSLELMGQENRTIEPSFIWIEFFPIVGQCWNVLISYQVAISIRNKLNTLPIYRSSALLMALGVSHAFVLASNMIAFFFVPMTTKVLFPLAMILMALWIWQLISVHKFVEAQRTQN